MKSVKYYFGRTSEDDYLAYKIGHIYLHGMTQFYLDAYADSFLLRFIEETTPNEVLINIHDCCASDIIWQDKFVENFGWKGIAHIGRVDYTSNEYHLIDSLKYFREVYEERLNCANLSKERNLLIVIRDYDRDSSPETTEIINFLLENGASAKMFLILTSSGTKLDLKGIDLDLFDYVLSATNTEENSLLLMGTNDASENVLPAFGFIVIKNCGEILRFHSLFYPYTFIKKMIRSLSVSKDAYH